MRRGGGGEVERWDSYGNTPYRDFEHDIKNPPLCTIQFLEGGVGDICVVGVAAVVAQLCMLPE